MKLTLGFACLLVLTLTVITAYAPNENKSVRIVSALIAPLWMILAMIVAIWVG